MNLVKYILERTPQSLNVLSSNLLSAEVYFELKLVDVGKVQVNYLIKSQHRLLINQFNLVIDAEFNINLLKKIQELATEHEITISKVFFSEESVYENFNMCTKEDLESINWNENIVCYLVRDKVTSIGASVLQQIIKEEECGKSTTLDLNFDFGFMTCMNPQVITFKLAEMLEGKVSENVNHLICNHYQLCYKVGLLREKIFGIRFNVKVGVTETRTDLIEKKHPKIIGLSYLQSIVCKYARDKVELREKRFNKNSQYKIAMDRKSLFDLVDVYGHYEYLENVLYSKVVYAEYLGKKVFYLVESDFFENLCSEFRASFFELNDESFEWLMGNIVGELCQQSAQRTIYHSITVHDHPSDIETLKYKAMGWFRSNGYRGKKLSIGHLATYIFQQENLNCV